MVGQERHNEPKACCSPRVSHFATVRSMGRRKEKAGREESKWWNQRRRVEGSGTRLGSLRDGATLSQERCSMKRRRSASLRVTRL
jgi:hypothetical protein